MTLSVNKLTNHKMILRVELKKTRWLIYDQSWKLNFQLKSLDTRRRSEIEYTSESRELWGWREELLFTALPELSVLMDSELAERGMSCTLSVSTSCRNSSTFTVFYYFLCEKSINWAVDSAVWDLIKGCDNWRLVVTRMQCIFTFFLSLIRGKNMRKYFDKIITQDKVFWTNPDLEEKRIQCTLFINTQSNGNRMKIVHSSELIKLEPDRVYVNFGSLTWPGEYLLETFLT